MDDTWFYIKLGLEHVLDLGAYDHILFLTALAIPFTFKEWKKVVLLATVFTIAHCASLLLSVYDVFRVDVGLIEFLIPVTIILTVFFNKFSINDGLTSLGLYLHILVTAFFGLIHGFGFSNYFNMLMAGEEQKLMPLFGFALGIEFSQVFIILMVLLIAYIVQDVFRVDNTRFVRMASILVAIITIPMLITAFPW
ncbi:HupE/UreJ family protein [uncultured Kriegella sp.]|uniref:HupE/UreJ family protein n=1 Tax=uncultured Kriegella sp. TaxID=1798910 RepID=UPI0030DBE40D|tara:strand:+ start:44693 stop:45277 length:585 start_codon:yes stop_codon:yes gene_type:complete